MEHARSTASETPNINVLSLRADVYRLLCLLLADEKINSADVFREVGSQIHEDEVNRLLIWIAVATRQLLELDDSEATAGCGRLWTRYPADDPEVLTLRKACDKVIHAIEIVPYDIPEGDDPAGTEVPPTTRYYAGRITLRTRASTRHPASRAELQFETFAEHCFRLTERLTQER
ncbi:MAG: hypothetical protein F4X99_18345 [Gammaproteobacteria bacterium]|nr:hypothetical protein [Gammaproteobacteria bacterium]